MHASNLLKAVLKPRELSSSSSGQTLSAKESKSRGPPASSADSGLSRGVALAKKASPVPRPAVRMSCLCAPTNHAGSFRCRLHRGNQRSWGGRPVPEGSKTSNGNAPSAAASGKGQSPASSIDGENGSSKRAVQQLPRPQPVMAVSPPQRSSDMPRLSRLSRVSAASDVDSGVAQASSPAPSPARRGGSSTVRQYLKFSNGAGSCGTNGAVIDGGMSFVKKLQTGGKDAMQEVFGSGTAMSRAALSL